VGAKWNSGGIAGQSTDAEIIACHNDGLIESQTSGWAGAGGICGFHKGTITACYHIGQVTGDSAIGAIVGEHNSGNISYCYWNGDLEGIPAGGGGSQTGNAKFGAAWPQPSTHEASVPELEQQASVISRPIATIKRVLIIPKRPRRSGAWPKTTSKR